MWGGDIILTSVVAMIVNYSRVFTKGLSWINMPEKGLDDAARNGGMRRESERC